MRTIRLPRGGAPIEPISSAERGYFGGPGFYLRIGIFAVLALAVFGLLAFRLWSLQVLQGPRYTQIAHRQTVRYVDLPAARGVIVDAKGRQLAGVTGQLVATAEATALGHLDRHGTWQASRAGRHVLVQLERVAWNGGLGRISSDVFVRRIRSGLLRSPYAPSIVLPRLTEPVSLYLDEHARDFPGIHVGTLPQRSYPQGALGGEFLGLLGEVGPTQLKEPRYRGAKPGQIVGQSGVEASYDRTLDGGLARAAVAVDAAGEPLGPLRPLRQTSTPGTLRLTIDASLQRTAERAVQDGIALAHKAGHTDAASGAAVVLDTRTGAIKALVSYPGFNQVAAAGSPSYYARLLSQSNPTKPLFNRAIQGLYPAGSTFKPIVAEAALATGLISPYTSLQCTPSLTVGGVVFHNVDGGIDESMTLPQALQISCDTWFYQLGEMFYARQQSTGAVDMQRWAHAFGLGHRTGLDLPGEAAGIVPTPAWLQKTFTEGWQKIWYEGYSVNLSIGQGYLAITPLQMAVAYATLANGGTVVRPHVADAVLNSSGVVTRKLRFPPRARLTLHDLWAIRDGLYAAAHSPTGTSAPIFSSFAIPVSGKTGTAQVPHGSDDSWYASWAPSDSPRYAVVVLIEHGGFGAQAAAPAAKEIYQALFHVGR